MKKTLFALISFVLLLIAIPGQCHAQSTGTPEEDPCFSLPNNGPCVCFPSGKLKEWLASAVIMEAKSELDQGGCNSLLYYLECYYRTEDIKIVYLGGDWENGQTFQVSRLGGGDILIVIVDGF
ncbi:MAG: hypothetical protein AAGN35_15360 [Bacteroidota bacterium]